MKVYVELLIPIILFVIFLIWRTWYILSQNKLIKLYKPENDKARRNSENGFFGELEGKERSVGISDVNIDRPEQPKRRKLLPTTKVDNARKDSFSFREFFKRRKNKK